MTKRPPPASLVEKIFSTIKEGSFLALKNLLRYRYLSEYGWVELDSRGNITQFTDGNFFNSMMGGQTLLQCAVSNEKVEACKLLLQYGADPTWQGRGIQNTIAMGKESKDKAVSHFFKEISHKLETSELKRTADELFRDYESLRNTYGRHDSHLLNRYYAIKENISPSMLPERPIWNLFENLKTMNSQFARLTESKHLENNREWEFWLNEQLQQLCDLRDTLHPSFPKARDSFINTSYKNIVLMRYIGCQKQNMLAVHFF